MENGRRHKNAMCCYARNQQTLQGKAGRQAGGYYTYKNRGEDRKLDIGRKSFVLIGGRNQNYFPCMLFYNNSAPALVSSASVSGCSKQAAHFMMVSSNLETKPPCPVSMSEEEAYM